MRTYSCVLFGRLEKLLEVFIALHVLVTSLAPLSHGLAVENEDVEEGVKEQDSLGLNAGGVEQHGDGTLVLEAVAVKCRLDHDKRIADVLVVENVPVESRLIR